MTLRPRQPYQFASFVHRGRTGGDLPWCKITWKLVGQGITEPDWLEMGADDPAPAITYNSIYT